MEFTRYIWELYADSDCGRAAIAMPAESFAGSRDRLVRGGAEEPIAFAFRAQLFREGPDGEPLPFEGELLEVDVREDIRTCFADREINDTDAARALFTELVR